MLFWRGDGALVCAVPLPLGIEMEMCIPVPPPKLGKLASIRECSSVDQSGTLVLAEFPGRRAEYHDLKYHGSNYND